MSNHLFGIVDIGLAFAVVFGLAIWQLVAVRRSIGRDRQEAQRQRADRQKAPDP